MIGFIIGIGKILPGVSGSVLAIRLNVYQKVVDTIANFFSDWKKNSVFLFKLALGFVLATIIGSKLLYLLFDKYEFYLKIIFALLILTGLPDLIKKSKSLIVTALMTIGIYILLSGINNFIYDCNINYFVAGIIESLSTIIPGVSGTSIYLNLGWYDDILVMFGNLYLFEFLKIIPFFFSFTIVSLLIIKIINFIMKKYEKIFYSFVSALMIVSIIFIF